MDVVGYALAAAVPESQVVTNQMWVAKANAPYDLYQFGMDKFPNDNIVVAGGGTPASSTTVYPYVRIYNPNTNTWTSETNMVQGRKGNIAAVCGANKDQVLIAGGVYYNSGWVAAPAYRYDINTNVYTTLPSSVNGKTYSLGGGFSDGRAYIAGGNNGSTTGSGGSPSPNTYVFDPSTNTFTMFSGASTLPNFPCGSATLDGGQFIAINGTPQGQTSTPGNDVRISDVIANTFTVKASSLSSRNGPAVFRMSNNRVVSVAGSTTGSSDTAEILDIVANVWTWAPMYSLSPRYEAKAITLSDYRVVVMGGYSTPRVVEMLSPTQTIITPGIKTVKAYLAAS